MHGLMLMMEQHAESKQKMKRKERKMGNISFIISILYDGKTTASETKN